MLVLLLDELELDELEELDDEPDSLLLDEPLPEDRLSVR